MSIDKRVAAIKANDEKVMQKFYKDNFGPVRLFVIQNSGTIDDAKDIYQEAYLSVWRNIQMDKFVPQHEKALDSYLFHIARHKWLDHLRSLPYKNTASLKPEQETLMTFDDMDDKNIEQIQLMKDRFRHLGENCRRLLKRFYYGKESMKAIAEDMGWTEASAKNNKYRCMEKLREMMR